MQERFASMLPTRFWAEMVWTDFKAADIADVIAILPVAAIEQHGPHLPLGVDYFLMQSYIGQVAARLPEDLPALFLPIQAVGASVEHSDFPGTLSLSAATLMRVLTEIAEGVHRAGCDKLVLLNSHGGNVALLANVAHELRAKLHMFVVMASWHRFGYPDGLFSQQELTHGIHGGDIETSLMLRFRPELVRLDAADDFASDGAALDDDFTWLRTGRPTGFGWMAQDLSEEGAVGNARAASKKKGEASADYGVTAFIELLQDIEAFDISRLRAGPKDA